MTPWGHPRRHLGGLDELAQLGVLQHRISAYDRPVRRVPCGDGRVIEPRDGLLQCALDPISADDDVCIKNLARCERDARPTLKGRVRLYVADRGIEPDAHARGGARKAKEHGMVIPAMDVVVWRTVIFNHAVAPPRVPDAGARIVSTEDDRRWFHADRFEDLAKPPVVQESRRVGRDLDACAYVAENGGRLEEGDLVSGVCERMGRGEAANACADDDDVEAERGAAAAVERRDFFQGNMCGQLCWGVRMVLHVV